MLRSVKELYGLTIRATDDEIGKVDDFLFDDERWTVRYMVVDTGGWLTGRLVLVSPRAIERVDWHARAVAVNLTRAKVENSPDIAADLPVSRQKESEYSQYYGYPPYWGSAGLWGLGMHPTAYLGYPAPHTSTPLQTPDQDTAPDAAEPEGDEHLRSTREVQGYHIHARDGEIGHVQDFVLEDETWAIRYVVVDTKNWWFGKHVLVAPEWITAVRWAEAMVDADLLRDEIKNSPQYDPDKLNRAYEQQLHRHYQRRGYWEDTPEPPKVS